MALVLTLKKDDDFYIDGVRHVVDEVRSLTDVSIRRPGDGKKWTLKDDMMAEIAPQVFASVGLRGKNDLCLCRIALEAPRHIPIMKGERLRREARMARLAAA